MGEFRSLNDLQDVILTHSVAPHQPGVLCTVSPSTLLYVDHSKTASEIHWLDLKDLKPNSSHKQLFSWVRYPHLLRIRWWNTSTSVYLRSWDLRLQQGK